ncbi:MAG: chromate resistance protein ChrB domain-containing protein [Rhodospirillales bacterium]
MDRVACPWLIRRFVDPGAVFLFVAPGEVAGTAARFGATPFDIEDCFWSHRGEQCTFDVMIQEFGLGGVAGVVAARGHRARGGYGAAGPGAAVRGAAGGVARAFRACSGTIWRSSRSGCRCTTRSGGGAGTRWRRRIPGLARRGARRRPRSRRYERRGGILRPAGDGAAAAARVLGDTGGVAENRGAVVRRAGRTDRHDASGDRRGAALAGGAAVFCMR